MVSSSVFIAQLKGKCGAKQVTQANLKTLVSR